MTAAPIPRLTGWRRLCATWLGWDYVAVADSTETEPRVVKWRAGVPHVRQGLLVYRLEASGRVGIFGQTWQPLTRRMFAYWSPDGRKLRAVRNA